jgi:hypothetical protein
VKPIKPMLDLSVQPLPSHEPHGVLSVRENGEPGPAAGFAKGGANSLTRKIVEITHGRKNLAPSGGFDAAKHHFELLALIFRVCRADKGSVDSNDRMLGGLLDCGLCSDLGFRLRLDRLSYGHDTIACRRVIKAREVWQEFIEDICGLLIGKLAA